jgi:hypothetical protein
MYKKDAGRLDDVTRVQDQALPQCRSNAGQRNRHDAAPPRPASTSPEHITLFQVDFPIILPLISISHVKFGELGAVGIACNAGLNLREASRHRAAAKLTSRHRTPCLLYHYQRRYFAAVPRLTLPHLPLFLPITPVPTSSTLTMPHIPGVHKRKNSLTSA